MDRGLSIPLQQNRLLIPYNIYKRRGGYDMTIYDFELEDNQGKKVALRDFSGKALLIVNTATRCGFTPQYKVLEELYRRYKDYGFEIIDVPI